MLVAALLPLVCETKLSAALVLLVVSAVRVVVGEIGKAANADSAGTAIMKMTASFRTLPPLATHAWCGLQVSGELTPLEHFQTAFIAIGQMGRRRSRPACMCKGLMHGHRGSGGELLVP